MKKSIAFLLALPILFVITGCPVGIAYPLGYIGTEKIDKRLIGSWSQTNTEMEVLKMTFEKMDNYTLKVTITERGSMFMEDGDVFRGWCTEINNQDFVYFQEIDSLAANYYHYVYTFENKELVTYDLGLLVGGIDAVTSTEAFRKEVMASMNDPEFLTGKIVWSKD